MIKKAAARISAPLQEFLALEASGGIVLLGGTVGIFATSILSATLGSLWLVRVAPRLRRGCESELDVAAA